MEGVDVPPSPDASAVDRGPAVDAIVRQVEAERPRLIDRFEATALIESFGYTDARVRRELGFADTLTLGSHVFDTLARRAAPKLPPIDRAHPPLASDLSQSIGSTFVYAIPWAAIVVVQRRHPEWLVVPADAGPPLVVAFLCSLVVSGGFVQALSRLGRFYIAVKQPRLAAFTCGVLFRVGVTATVVCAIAALAAGWYFTSLPWPALVIAADEIVILTVMWMICAVLMIRDQYWRVTLAFAAGALVFPIVRAAGGDTLASALAAAGSVLAAALVQLRWVFAAHTAASVPLPRFSVLLYRASPYFCDGALYFAFICATRLTAMHALSRAPASVRDASTLGLDIALVSFLFGSAAIEVANRRFAHLLIDAARQSGATADALNGAAASLHRRALAIGGAGFMSVAIAIGGAAMLWLRAEPPTVWTTLAVADLGYLLFAIGSLNALILVGLSAPWAAAGAMAAAVIVSLIAGLTMDGLSVGGAGGLLAGGAVAAFASTGAVYGRLRHTGYAVAAF